MFSVYKHIIRPLLFSCAAETAHDCMIKAAQAASIRPVQDILRGLFCVADARLEQNLFGLRFANPFGLAAGLDKNCAAPEFFFALGFAHLELGTVTACAQSGNPKPRIFRLRKEQALINRMGFPSSGADAVAARLARFKRGGQDKIIGVNIGKSRHVEIDNAAQDYCDSFRRLYPFGDYFVLNVSSPNTPELRKLQERERLSALLQSIAQLNSEKKPVCVKLSPDLDTPELDSLLECTASCGVSALIATNTTLSRDGVQLKSEIAGGLSGRPLKERSLRMISYIHRATNGRTPIIGVGGISTFQDALDAFHAGASLVQIYTGLIYEGPHLVSSLARDLICHLEVQQCPTLTEYLKRVHAAHLA